MSRDLLLLVSHELRTPLTCVAGYVQVLREALVDAGPIERRSLDAIARSAARLQRLADDLVVAADGVLELEHGPVCLEALVREAVDAARPVASASGVALDVTHGRVGVVEGDACRLAQVLDNLLSNAVKFSDDGGRVSVALCQDGDRVAVSVRDEGIGVGEAELPRLGEPFFRASTARMVPGTGLGLSLSKAIVEAHGGQLRFASAVGSGTTVTVLLPAAAVAEQPVAA